MRDAYVPNFKVPGKKKPSYVMLITLILCVVLPPVGLILLWGRARCPMRGKVWMSVLSVGVMVAGLTWYLSAQNANNFIIPSTPITHTYGVATPAPTEVPPPVSGTNAPDSGNSGAEGNGGVIPANPMG